MSAGRWLLGVVVVLAVLVFGYVRFFTDRPFTDRPDTRSYDSTSLEEEFKYESVSSEPGGSPFAPVGGMLPPYQVFNALPRVCPEMGIGSYKELGLIYEQDPATGKERELPVGISRRRRLGFDMIGINCALCHAGTWREAPGATPHVVAGMPPQQVDAQRLLRFMLSCIQSDAFTPASVLRAIEADGTHVNPADRIAYRLLIPKIRGTTRQLASRVGVLTSDAVPASGPGRLDTVNPGKALEVGWSLEALVDSQGPGLTGTMDFPPVWNLKERRDTKKLRMHWDGNLGSVHEAVLSALLAVGVKPETYRADRLDDVLFALKPPPYPFLGDQPSEEGRRIFQEQRCFECHAFGGSAVGQVTPIEIVGTDRHRFDAFSPLFAAKLPEALNRRYAGSVFRFQTFQKTAGYVNVPLDGLWARAPYLHNGSVPTLRDLLDPPGSRPRRFCRGSDVIDREKVGFLSYAHADPTTDDECQRLAGAAMPAGVKPFLFDTELPGNGNGGHRWGTDLEPRQKDALVEYLKRL
jgi:hypothetical protein